MEIRYIRVFMISALPKQASYHKMDRADKVSQIQRIKVSIAIIIANPFNFLD